MQWELRVVSRDLATTYGSFTSDADLAVDDPRLAFQLRDPLNDVGVGKLSLPITAEQNDWIVEDRLLLLFVRGVFATGALIGVADDDLLHPEEAKGQIAAYGLTTLLDLLNEALVYPARGPSSPTQPVDPPGDDRIFDSSDPHYDASGWDSPDELMSVTDAQTGWELTPFAGGMPSIAADVAQVIGPPGYSATPDPAPPKGSYYYRIDFDVVGGDYRCFVTADDGHGPFRIDGTNFVSQLVTQFGNCSQFDVHLSAGTHTFWCLVVQSEDPDNPGDGIGPSGLAFAMCPRLQNDEVDYPELVSDYSWSVWTDVDTTPGFTPGNIGTVTQFEGVARGVFQAPVADFDANVDSDADDWPGTTVRSTKAAMSTMATLFCKEMGEDTCDTAIVVEDDTLKWKMWPHGGRGAVKFVALTEHENIGSLTINRARTAMTSAVCRAHDRFYEVDVDPVAGHPRKEAGLSLGAAQTYDEVATIATPQLDQFGRIREKISVTHVTGPQTPDLDMPGVGYNVADTILVPVARDFTPQALRIIAMTWELQASGLLAATPEFGDIIVPAEARPAQALGKMAPGLRARPVTPPSL